MLPPGLSMLWEDADAPAALRDRFGFRDLQDASTWISSTLRSTWGLRVQQVERLVISDQNVIAWVGSGSGPLVLKWSRDAARFPRLEAVARLIAQLQDQGIPVAAPLAIDDGELRPVLPGPRGDLSLSIQPEIAGTWLDAEDPGTVRTAGRQLARLHQALARCEAPQLETQEHDDLREALGRWLEGDGPSRAPEASARLASMLQDAPPLSDQRQLVHRDYRAANILTADGRITAVLDFDEVRSSHRLVDLAQASVLLATRFRDWGPTSPAARAALRAGYTSVIPMTGDDEAWLDLLTLWIGIAMIPEGPDGQRWAQAL